MSTQNLAVEMDQILGNDQLQHQVQVSIKKNSLSISRINRNEETNEQSMSFIISKKLSLNEHQNHYTRISMEYEQI